MGQESNKLSVKGMEMGFSPTGVLTPKAYREGYFILKFYTPSKGP